MFKKYLFYFSLLLFSSLKLSAQYDAPLFAAYTTDAARSKMNERLVANTILKNLSLPLSDSTEENWEDAFGAMEVMDYNTPLTRRKIHHAFDSVGSSSISFQRALLEVSYSLYPRAFAKPVHSLADQTTDPKIFAMCAEYLLRYNSNDSIKISLTKKLLQKFSDSASRNPILFMLRTRLATGSVNTFTPMDVMSEILSKNFLLNQIVMFSFQRKNRDYPGMVLIRNAEGKFIIDSLGNIFNVPQLARGISNLPFYLTNGNTPQGIFRMYGFGVSMSNFIGPTPNVQMGMPVEISMKNFLDDSTILDSNWTIDRYQKLLPKKLKDYLPLYHSYYAGLAGRSEIIAHGTTIDPGYYSDKLYYPLTPTQGCLCTKEIWNGKRVESDQQKLVNALLKAGGGKGYCVVIEIDDKHMPVTMADLAPYLSKQ